MYVAIPHKNSQPPDQSFFVIFFTFSSYIPYFFGYKTELFFFQNNLKDLDPSCKTDLDLLDCLGRVNLEL